MSDSFYHITELSENFIKLVLKNVIKLAKGSLNKIFQDSFNKILSQQLIHGRSYISRTRIVRSYVANGRQALYSPSVYGHLSIVRRQTVKHSKLKDFADDNFKIDENDIKFSKRVENIVGKGKIARYEQLLLLSHSVFKGLVLQTRGTRARIYQPFSRTFFPSDCANLNVTQLLIG